MRLRILSHQLTAPCCVAMFGDHIRNVVLLSAKKQMVGIAARWVVAAVKYTQSLWNLTVMQLPGKTMCWNPDAMRPSFKLQTTVASVFSTYPIPTGVAVITTINARPEPVFNASNITGMSMHKTVGLSFRPPKQFIGFVRYSSNLPATALTESKGDVRIRLHGEPPTQVSCAAPRGVISTAEAFACPHYSTEVRDGGNA